MIFSPQLTLEKCSKEDAQAYVYHLAKQVNARSQARQISGLKVFNFLIFEGYREDSHGFNRSTKIGRKLPEVLSTAEIEKMFSS